MSLLLHKTLIKNINNRTVFRGKTLRKCSTTMYLYVKFNLKYLQ